MARYCPWRAEMVIAGRPLAVELLSAWSSWVFGFRRLVRAWASILPAWWSLLETILAMVDL